MKKNFVKILSLAIAIVLGIVFVPNVLSRYYYTKAKKIESYGEYKKALVLYEKAAKHKNANAYYQIGTMLRDKNIVDSVDYDKALECFEKAVLLGKKEANYEIGSYWQQMTGNIEKAMSYYEKDAGENSKFSFYNMGMIYKLGLGGIESDSIKYMTYIKHAAEMGAPHAEYEYGIILLEGILLKKDVKSAVEWLEKAYLHKSWHAGSILSEMYYKGTEIPRDMEKGFNILRTCAENGYKDCYSLLGAKYALGEGVVRDYDQSFFWFNKSAELGYLNGMYNLGLSYVNGWGTQKDVKKGEELLNAAKEKGFPDAIQYFKNKERQRALEAAELKRQRGNEVVDCPFCRNGYSGTTDYGGKYTLPTVCPWCNGRGWVRRHELE